MATNTWQKSYRKQLAKKRERQRVRRLVYAVEQCGSFNQACVIAGVAERTLRRYRDKSPEFEQAIQLAKQQYIERAEAEADRRGLEGYTQPVFHGGKIVGERRRYSDALLALRLKAMAPDKYAERKSVNVKTDQVHVYIPDNRRNEICNSNCQTLSLMVCNELPSEDNGLMVETQQLSICLPQRRPER